MFCRQCGAQRSNKALFCAQCGLRVGAVLPAPRLQPYPQSHPYPLPFLSRKQFGESSPQIQELHKKCVLWTWLSIGFLWSGIIGSIFFLPLGVLSIPSIVFSIMAVRSAMQANKMYKEYMIQYQNQFWPPAT